MKPGSRGKSERRLQRWQMLVQRKAIVDRYRVDRRDPHAAGGEDGYYFDVSPYDLEYRRMLLHNLVKCGASVTPPRAA